MRESCQSGRCRQVRPLGAVIDGDERTWLLVAILIIPAVALATNLVIRMLDGEAYPLFHSYNHTGIFRHQVDWRFHGVALPAVIVIVTFFGAKSLVRQRGEERAAAKDVRAVRLPTRRS